MRYDDDDAAAAAAAADDDDYDDDDDSQHFFSAVYLWNHIQRRLAPQIGVIKFTFAGLGMF